jgi:hypothetical protein
MRALPSELLRFLFHTSGLAAHHFELFDDGVGQMRFDLAAQLCGAGVECSEVVADSGCIIRLTRIIFYLTTLSPVIAQGIETILRDSPPTLRRMCLLDGLDATYIYMSLYFSSFPNDNEILEIVLLAFVRIQIPLVFWRNKVCLSQ